jgi:hypothetical protein
MAAHCFALQFNSFSERLQSLQRAPSNSCPSPSPFFFFLRGGEVLWDARHVSRMLEALRQATSEDNGSPEGKDAPEELLPLMQGAWLVGSAWPVEGAMPFLRFPLLSSKLQRTWWQRQSMHSLTSSGEFAETNAPASFLLTIADQGPAAQPPGWLYHRRLVPS